MQLRWIWIEELSAGAEESVITSFEKLKKLAAANRTEGACISNKAEFNSPHLTSV
jgi:hypothetical protein